MQVRAVGARIKLIEDGDLMTAISVAVAGTGVHAVMGTGGAPEGVLLIMFALELAGGLAVLAVRPSAQRSA